MSRLWYRCLVALWLVLLPAWAAADVVIRGGQFVAQQALGTQEFSLPGLVAPQAFMVWVTSAIASGTRADHAILSLGMADCTRQGVLGARSLHNTIPESSRRRAGNDAIIRIEDPVLVDPQATAVFDACLTDGLRVNWTVAPTQPFLIQVMFFAGSTLGVHVDSFISAIVGGTRVVDTVGFEPEVVFLTTNDRGGLEEGAQAMAQMALGIATNNGVTVVQHSVGVAMGHDSPIGSGAARLSTVDIQVPDDGGGLGNDVRLQNFNATGFDAFTPGDGSEHCLFLALDLPADADAALQLIGSPTAPGMVNYTGLGLQPDVLFFVGSILTTNDSTNTNDAAVMTLGYRDSQGGALTSSFGIQIDASPTNTFSYGATQAILTPGNDGNILLNATLTSFDSDGFSMNYSATTAITRRQFVLGISTAAVVAQPAAFYVSPRRFGH